MGLCVQGGAPLIGGRGMLADATCLWIAVVLSVFGAVLLTTVTEPDSDSGVSHTDREVCVVSMTPRGRGAEHQNRSLVPPSRNGRCFVQSGSPKRRLQYSSARAAGLHGSGHARLPRCQQSRSLSLTYLSLSGAWPPIQGGWGAVHHSTRKRARGALLRGSASSQGTLILKGMEHVWAKRDRLDLAPFRLLIGRTCPVFL